MTPVWLSPAALAAESRHARRLSDAQRRGQLGRRNGDTVNRSEAMRSVALDALAIIACAHTGDRNGGAAMLATYNDPAEVADLLCAVTAHAVSILRLVSEVTGCDPEKILGSVATGLRALETA